MKHSVSDILAQTPHQTSVSRPGILIYASGKQVQYASVKTVRLTYQALELLHGRPKRQVQGALGHQQIKHSASDILAQMPTLLKSPHCLLMGHAHETSVSRPDICIYASGKQVQYASVKTVRLTYQTLELLHRLPKRQVQGALGHQQIKHSASDILAQMPTLLKSPHCLLLGHAHETSVSRPDILIYASGKQVQYASVKTVRLTYQALELLHGLPKRQVQGALGHQQIKHCASDILAQMPTLLKSPHCLLLGHAHETSVSRPDILIYASGKQVQYASVKTVRLTYQALELLHGRPKRQVQGALGHQQIKHSVSDILAQTPHETSVSRPDILIYASGKQVQYASVKTVRLTYQALELLHGRPKRQVQGALGHQQIKHSASDMLAQMPTLLKSPHCLLLGHPHETSVKHTNISGKQVHFASVKTVRLIVQTLEVRASSQNSKQKRSRVTTRGLAQIFHGVLKVNTPHGTKPWQQSQLGERFQSLTNDTRKFSTALMCDMPPQTFRLDPRKKTPNQKNS